MADRDAFELLIPAPAEVKLSEGSVAAQELAREPETVDAPGIRPGGYRLRIAENACTLASGDSAGRRAGSATLAQLRTIAGWLGPGERLPAVEIIDAPAVGRRGVMLDVSRSRVPTMDEFGSMIDAFAGLKINHLQCYTEHAFAYRAHPAVWAGADPMTPAEVRALDERCAGLGIELVANQNCFGHLTRWLRLPEYEDLAETHGDWVFAGMARSGPFSLCPMDARSLPFVESLLDEIMPCFASAMVNIGCDETYDIGQGRSREAVARDGKAAVYGRFVGSVCRAVMDRGGTPMFWADIAKEHPNALSQIPASAHAMVWGYEPGHDFAAEARLHRESGRPWWACPGTSSWRGFTGRSSERRANIRSAAAAAVEHAAEGMLITDWGDLGHQQVWPIAMLSIAEGADAAWTGRGRLRRFLEAVSLHVFGDRSLSIAAWLEEFGDADEPLRAVSGARSDADAPRRLLNASALFTELHPPPLALRLPPSPSPWEACRERLISLGSRVPTGGGKLVTAELHHAVRSAVWACDVAISRRGGKTDPGLRARRDELAREQAALWVHRSRTGGLDESLAFWDEIELGDRP